MNAHAHEHDGQPGTVYVIHVRPASGGYRASLREVAGGETLDVRTLPTGAAGHGTGATAPAAILAAVVAVRIPATVVGSPQLKRRRKDSDKTGQLRPRRRAARGGNAR